MPSQTRFPAQTQTFSWATLHACNIKKTSKKTRVVETNPRHLWYNQIFVRGMFTFLWWISLLFYHFPPESPEQSYCNPLQESKKKM